MENALLIQNSTVDELCDRICSNLAEKLKNQSFNNNNATQFLTRKETAELLKVTLPTLNTYTKEGRIRASRVGRRVLYSIDEIKNALADRRAIL